MQIFIRIYTWLGAAPAKRQFHIKLPNLHSVPGSDHGAKIVATVIRDSGTWFPFPLSFFPLLLTKDHILQPLSYSRLECCFFSSLLINYSLTFFQCFYLIFCYFLKLLTSFVLFESALQSIASYHSLSCRFLLFFLLICCNLIIFFCVFCSFLSEEEEEVIFSCWSLIEWLRLMWTWIQCDKKPPTIK